MTIYLLLPAVALVAGLAAAYAVWLIYDRRLGVERMQRRVAQHERDAAQRETADLLDDNDRLTKTGREARAGVHALWLDWWAAWNAEQGAKTEAATWQTAYADGLSGAVPVAAQAILAPAGSVTDDELDTWAAVNAMHPDALAANRTTEIRREMLAAIVAEASVPA